MSNNLKVLKGLDAVRERPSMYCMDGAQLTLEVLDNSVDEAINDYATEITVIHDSRTSQMTISDNGRGIPSSYNTEEKMSNIEIAATVLHGSGKFDKEQYKFSGGLNGVGLSVVNALSIFMEVKVKQNGSTHTFQFSKGKKTSETVSSTPKLTKKDTGTSISFIIDKPYISLGDTYNRTDANGMIKFDYIKSRLSDLSNLLDSVTFTLIQITSDGKEEKFVFKGSIDSFSQTKGSFLRIDLKEESGTQGCIFVKPTFDSTNALIRTFANLISVEDGGSHLTGVKQALTQFFTKDIILAKEMSTFKGTEALKKLSGDQIIKYFEFVFIFMLDAPLYRGNQKTFITNSELRTISYNGIKDYLKNTFNFVTKENTKITNDFLKVLVIESKAADNASKYKSNGLEAAGLKESNFFNMASKKLSPCESSIPEECEIFLCEGLSAGGSIKDGRNSYNQAVYPLRGKVSNLSNTNDYSVELSDLTLALGCGTGTKFKLSTLRYHKICILADSDSDGNHINSLILNFFRLEMSALIENGHVYAVIPPLYAVTVKSKTQYCSALDYALIQWMNLEKVNPLINAKTKLPLKLKNDKLKIAFFDLVDEVNKFTSLIRADFDITSELILYLINTYVKTGNCSVDDDVFSKESLFESGLELLNELTISKQYKIEQHDAVFGFTGKDFRTFSFSNLFVSLLKTIDKVMKLFNYEEISLVSNVGNNFLSRFSDIKKASNQGFKVTRFKGIGEMNHDQVSETCLDESKRNLVQIGFNESDESIDLFMSDKYIEARKIILKEILNVADVS